MSEKELASASSAGHRNCRVTGASKRCASALAALGMLVGAGNMCPGAVGVDAMVTEAIEAGKAGEHSHAVAILEEAVGLDPGDLQVRVLLANACYQDFQVEKAIRQWTLILKRNPENKQAREWLQRVRHARQAPRERLELARALAKEKALQSALSILRELAGDEKAEELRQEVLVAQAQVLLEIGMAADEEKKMMPGNEVVRLAQQAITQFPETPRTNEALLLVGRANQSLIGDYRQAARVYRELLNRRPEAETAARAKVEMAWCACQFGDPAAGRRQLEDFIRDNPQSAWLPTAQNRLATVHMDLAAKVVPTIDAVPVIEKAWQVIQSIETSEAEQAEYLRENAIRAAELFSKTGVAADSASAVYAWLAAHAASDRAEAARYSLEAGRILIRAERAAAGKHASLRELDRALTDRGKRALDLLDELIANWPEERHDAAREVLAFASWFEETGRRDLARQVLDRLIAGHEGLDVAREARFETGRTWLHEGKRKPVKDAVLPEEVTKGLAEFEKLLPLVKDDPLLKKVTGEVEQLAKHLKASSRKLAYEQIRWILGNVPDAANRKQLALRSVDLAQMLAEEEIADLKVRRNPEALKQLIDWHRKGAATMAMLAGKEKTPAEAQQELDRFASYVNYYKGLQGWEACDELIAMLADGTGLRQRLALRLRAEVAFHKGQVFYDDLKNRGIEADDEQLTPEMLAAITTDAQRLKTSPDPLADGIVETIAGFYRARNLVDLAVEAYLAAAAQKVSPDFDADKLLKAARVLLAEGRRLHQDVMQTTREAGNWSGPELKRGLALLVRLMTDYPDAELLKDAAAEYTLLAQHYRSCKGWDRAVEVLEARKAAFPESAQAAAVDLLIADTRTEAARSEFLRRESLQDETREADDGRVPEALAAALQDYLALRKTYPDSGEARTSVSRIMGMAFFFAKRHEWRKAVSLLETFLAAEPEFARADQFYYQIGLCHMGIFDPKAHISALAESMKRTADNVERLIAAVANTRRLHLGRVGYVPDYLPDIVPYEIAGKGGEEGERLAKSEARTGLKEGGFRTEGKKMALEPPRQGEPAPAPADQSAAPPAGTPVPGPSRRPQTGRESGDADEVVPPVSSEQLARLALQTDLQGTDDIQYVRGITSQLELSDEQADRAYKAFMKVLKDYPESPLRDSSIRELMVIAQSYRGRELAGKAAAMYERLAADLPRLQNIEDIRLEIARSRVKAGEQVSETDQEACRARIDEWFARARDGFRDFLNRFPNSPNLDMVRTELTNTYLVQARTLMKDHRNGSVRALLEGREALLEALVRDPRRGDASRTQLADFATSFEGLKAWADAIDTYNLHLKHFPASPAASSYMKRTAEIRERQMQHYARAVTDYLEYIQGFQPSDAGEIRGRIYSLAERLKGEKRFAEAIEIYKQYVSNFPNDNRAAECWHNIGSMYFDNNLWEEAVESFEELIAEYPNSPQMLPAHLDIARCYSCLSRWTEAGSQYEKYIEKGGQPSPGITGKVRALRKLGKFQDFIDTYKEHRKRSNARFALAQIIQSDLQLPCKAILEYRKVVKEYPGCYHADDALFAIARLHLARNDMEKARKAARNLVERYPESPLADDALYLAGQSYEREAEALRRTTVEQVQEQQVEFTQRDAIRRIADQSRGNRRRVFENLKDLNAAEDLGREARELSQFNYQVNKDQQMWLRNDNTLFQAQQESTKLTAFERRNIQDKVNAKLRNAVETYREVASLYRTRDKAAEALQRVVKIYSDELRDKQKWVEVVQTLVKHHPSSKISEGPSFEIGRYYQRDEKYAGAIQAYNQFLYNFPKSDRIRDARFMIAECQEQLGKWINAIDAYQDFINRYPTHPMAKRARDRINWIKAYHL